MLKNKISIVQDKNNNGGASVKVAHNFFFLMLLQVLTKIISFGTLILIARYLSIGDFGKYSFILAFIGFFSMISNLGLDALVIREIARDQGIAEKYLINSIMLKTFFFLFCFIIFAFISIKINIPRDTFLIILIFSLAVIPQVIQNLFSSLFMGMQQMMKCTMMAILVDTLRFILVATILLLGYKLIGLAVAYLVSYVVALLFNYFILVRHFIPHWSGIDFSFARTMLKESIPFMVYGFFFLVYFKIDIFMLSFMKGNEEVGRYALSYRLIDSLMFIPAALMGAVFPALSQFSKSSIKNIKTGCEKALKYLSSLGIPLAVGITILAPQIIPLFYGKSYKTSVLALQILSWGLALIFINCICQVSLNATNKQRINVLVMFVGIIINVSLNLVLIPHFSIIGASIATVITELIITYLSFYFLVKYVCQLQVAATIYKPALASLFMGLLIFMLGKLNIFFIVPLAIFIYTFFMWLLRYFDNTDIQLFLRVFRFRREKAKA